MLNKLKILFINLLFILLSKNCAFSDNNFVDIDFGLDNVKNIKKIWTYNSGIFKDSQTKPILHNDKIIFLDGHKNLRVLSIFDGNEICINKGNKDTKPIRGIGLYKKNSDEVYAVFVRNKILVQVNIFNCKQRIFDKNVFLPSVVAPVLVDDNIAYILRNNGKPPVSYNLDNLEIVWEAKIENQTKKKLLRENSNNKLKWNVWGGALIDKRNNQLIFSTSNPKPGFISKNRKGKNLFHNSLVSVNLKNGVYNWHFQEIEHDLLNLDLASPPILVSFIDHNQNYINYVAQATKTGQLLLINPLNGLPTEETTIKEFFPYKNNDEIKTVRKYFPDWLIYSKSNFVETDINNLSDDYKNQAKLIINESIISEYQALEKNKDYIFYGMHGGTEWPYIASTKNGVIIIPSNNIPWIARLNDSYGKQFINLVKEIFNFEFYSFEIYFKRIKRIISKILNYDAGSIQEYKKFETKNGIPLNKPPWGTLTAIDIKNKKQLWTIPHGKYPILNKKYKNTGSEIFGSPVIVGNIIFMSGTINKEIVGYDLNNGKKIWTDKLPYVSYGNLSINKYEDKIYLIVNSTGGSKMPRTEKGDAIVAYILN
jgi:glucose dehydrogenase